MICEATGMAITYFTESEEMVDIQLGKDPEMHSGLITRWADHEADNLEADHGADLEAGKQAEGKDLEWT